MRLFCLLPIFAGLASSGWATQINFDSARTRPAQMPPGFVSLVTGEGKPANWGVTEGIGAADACTAFGQSTGHHG